jgi:hypothetical protein
MMADDVVHIFHAFSVLDICARSMPENASETFAKEKRSAFREAKSKSSM